MQVVIFDIGTEQYAINTSKVQNINEMLTVTKIPNSEAYIRGLINLRGNTLPLIDMTMILNGTVGDSTQNKIIVLYINDEKLGIAVDKVEAVLEITEKDIDAVMDLGKREFIQGVININGKIITLLDTDKLLK